MHRLGDSFVLSESHLIYRDNDIPSSKDLKVLQVGVNAAESQPHVFGMAFLAEACRYLPPQARDADHERRCMNSSREVKSQF